MDSAGSVLAVVGADADAVEILFVGDKLFVAVVASYAFNAVLLEESFGLAGNEVGACDDFNVGHMLVGFHMSVCNPAGTDDTDL